MALERFEDKIILGLDRDCSDNSCIVSFSINSEATSNTQVPVLISETISFPPRLSSDIALSILTVKLLLCIVTK